jgi:hypothetical protein
MGKDEIWKFGIIPKWEEEIQSVILPPLLFGLGVVKNLMNQ